MRRRSALVLAFVVACGGASTSEPATPRGSEPAPGGPPPAEPLSETDLRARWEKLAVDEAAVVATVDELARLAPAERASRLGQAQERAGFVASGLRIMTPPPSLSICQRAGAEGASELKTALDGIHALWTGPAGPDRKATADRLAESLCRGAGKLAAARAQCGVVAKVPSPFLCATSQ